MQVVSILKKQLYQFETYKSGLKIHLALLAVYSLVFIGVYYMMRLEVEPDDIKAYHQRQLSKGLLITMLLQLLSLIYFRWPQFLLLIKEYFTEKGSPYNLAVFRIIFFFTLGGRFLFHSPKHDVIWTYLPDSSRVGLPFMNWFVQSIPISPVLFNVCSITAGVLCWLVCFGLFTKRAAILVLPFAFYVLGVPMFFGKISHYHILMWVPILLALAPMADVLSFDALIKKRIKKVTSKHENHLKYLFPFKIIWLVLAIIYGFAGAIKLWDCGLDWALSDSVVNQMQWEWVEHYDKVPGFRIDRYPVLAKLGGLSVIYFELLYFLLLIKPAGRIWAFVGAYSFHKICGYFMYIDFADLRQVALTYINWDKASVFIKNKFKPVQKKVDDVDPRKTLDILKYEKLMLPFFIGMLFIVINFTFSVFRIHSYPFSSYPTYSAIIKDKIKVIRMKALTEDGKEVNVKQLGIDAKFRWENIRNYEVRIAESFEQGDTNLVNVKLKEYWQLWKNNVSGLDNVIRVELFLETTSIVPEKRKEVLRSDFLGVVYP